MSAAGPADAGRGSQGVGIAGARGKLCFGSGTEAFSNSGVMAHGFTALTGNGRPLLRSRYHADPSRTTAAISAALARSEPPHQVRARRREMPALRPTPSYPDHLPTGWALVRSFAIALAAPCATPY